MADIWNQWRHVTEARKQFSQKGKWFEKVFRQLYWKVHDFMLFWDGTHGGNGCVSQDGALRMLPWVHEVGGHAWMPCRYFAQRTTMWPHPPAVEQLDKVTTSSSCSTTGGRLCDHIKLFLPLHFKHSDKYRCADRYLIIPVQIMSQWPQLTTSTAPWVWWKPPPPKDTLTFPN